MTTEHAWITPVTADLLRGFVDVETTARGAGPCGSRLWAIQPSAPPAG